MLVVSFADGTDLDWHTGEEVSFDTTEKLPIEVQADCHELEYIERRFTNLPMVRNGGVIRWFGDHARFIFANMGWKIRYD